MAPGSAGWPPAFTPWRPFTFSSGRGVRGMTAADEISRRPRRPNGGSVHAGEQRRHGLRVHPESSRDSRGTGALYGQRRARSRPPVRSGSCGSRAAGTERRSPARRRCYTAPKKFQGFTGIGVQVPTGSCTSGSTPACSTTTTTGRRAVSPFLYDILSFKSKRHGREVFTTAFASHGSSDPRRLVVPFVSDLGLDSGARKLADFILRVHERRRTSVTG